MLGENAIGDSQHVSGHPGHGHCRRIGRVRSQNRIRARLRTIVLERRRGAFDHIEESFATRCAMRTVLHVVR